jgi:hypothetical protein
MNAVPEGLSLVENGESEEEPIITPMTFTLVSPLDDVSEVTLREPTVDELAKLNDDSKRFGEVRAMKNLLSTMTKIDFASIGKMGARDFRLCNKYLSRFFD